MARSLLRAFLPLVALSLPVAAPAAPAFDDATPEGFVRHAYSLYATSASQGVPTLGKPGTEWFTEEMAKGFALAEKMNDEEVGPIDYDPVCGCQDWGSLKLTSLAVTKKGDADASVKVAFTNLGDKAAKTLDLKKGPNGWRIADIHDKSGGDASILETFRKLEAKSKH